MEMLLLPKAALLKSALIRTPEASPSPETLLRGGSGFEVPHTFVYEVGSLMTAKACLPLNTAVKQAPDTDSLDFCATRLDLVFGFTVYKDGITHFEPLPSRSNPDTFWLELTGSYKGPDSLLFAQYMSRMTPYQLSKHRPVTALLNGLLCR